MDEADIDAAFAAVAADDACRLARVMPSSIPPDAERSGVFLIESAVRLGSLQCVSLLLKAVKTHGKDRFDFYGRFLDEAFSSSPKLLDLLGKVGIDEITTDRGISVFMKTIRAGKFAFLDKLLSMFQINVNHICENGDRALSIAFESESLNCFHQLLLAGASPNFEYRGKDAFIFSVLERSDKPAFAELLVANSPLELNVRRSEDGMTPVLYVCWKGIFPIFRLFLNQVSPDGINAVDSRGMNALFLNICGDTNEQIIITLLKDEDFVPKFLLADKSSVYHMCSEHGGSIAVPLIFARHSDWDINIRINGLTPLDSAVANRDLSCCEALLKCPNIDLSEHFMQSRPLFSLYQCWNGLRLPPPHREGS
jgi:ankyrin repeat protein